MFFFFFWRLVLMSWSHINILTFLTRESDDWWWWCNGVCTTRTNIKQMHTHLTNTHSVKKNRRNSRIIWFLIRFVWKGNFHPKLRFPVTYPKRMTNTDSTHKLMKTLCVWTDYTCGDRFDKEPCHLKDLEAPVNHLFNSLIDMSVLGSQRRASLTLARNTWAAALIRAALYEL